MKPLIDDNFILRNETAKILYNKYAKEMPIIDFHCHLDPQAIAEDKQFNNITELWLGGDHYKWRAMRAAGIEEAYITGDKTPKEKFEKWATLLPNLIGNPLLHWSAMELKTYFNIEKPLNESTWEEIYDECNEKLATSAYSVRALIKKSNVEVVCTTDDPIDSLEFHKILAADSTFDVMVAPAFRPDKALRIGEKDFPNYIGKLGNVVGETLSTFNDIANALNTRIDFFHENGGFISDHAFQTIHYVEATMEELNSIVTKALSGETLTFDEISAYEIHLLYSLAKKYKELDWAMQLHIGAIRNINEQMAKKLGPDTGYDYIGDYHYIEDLGKVLNHLELNESLPKTILYNLFLNLNYPIETLAGSFQQEGYRSKVQLGAPWWFGDQKDGIKKHFNDLGNLGVLSDFVGMLTDSRSFISYPRHDYFRRILCHVIGEWVEDGELYYEEDRLGKIIRDISYNNAFTYFNLSTNILKK